MTILSEIKYHCLHKKDWQSIAKQILSTHPTETIYAIYGPMGAGKTTLVQGFCNFLETQDLALSPTYSLINEYSSKLMEHSIYHMDLYRLKSPEEALDLGCEELLYGENICFIEWPEIIETLLPTHYVEVRISKPEPQSELRHIIINKR